MRRSTSLALALALVASLVPAVHAGPGGEIGVFFDPAGTVSGQEVFPFVPFSLYVIHFQAPDPGIAAYEFGMNTAVDPSLILLGCFVNPPTSINVGNCDSPIVGTGACVVTPTFVMVEYQFLSIAPLGTDIPFCLGPSSPSSFGGVGPGYLDCDNGLHLYGLRGSGCAVINPTAFPEPMAELSLDLVNAEVGTLVVMPVTVSVIPIIKGDFSSLAGIDLELSWDPSVATLENVTLANATSSWFVEFNAGVGVADISAAGTDPVAIPTLATEQVLLLEFRAGQAEGFTPVDITSSRLFDIDQLPLDHIPVGGSLFVQCDKGDPVEDDEVNSADAIRTLLIAVGLFNPTPLQFCAADMNSDGVVDVGDAVLVLQKAVGLINAGPDEPVVPELFLLSGREPGEVLLQVSEATGVDAIFQFDPEHVRFMAAGTDGPEGLVVSNGKSPGTLRVGFASAREFTGTIRLNFEVDEPAETMKVKFASAFDVLAQRHIVDLGDHDFIFGVTGVDGTPGLGRALEFLGGTPNPFNPSTELRFRLATPGDVTLVIFDAAGRRVRLLRAIGLSAGENGVRWDGTDDQGRTVASGVYQVRIESALGADGGRVVLLK